MIIVLDLLRRIQTSPTTEAKLKVDYTPLFGKETTSTCSCNGKKVAAEQEENHWMRTILDNTEHENTVVKNTETEQEKKNWLRTILDTTEHENTVAKEIEMKTQFVSNIPLRYRGAAVDPEKCIGVDTKFGRDLLASTLHNDVHGRIFFTLWQQFLTQSDSLLCGPSSIVMVLNALKVDPGRKWRYPWRWFDEGVLNKCQPNHHSMTNGMSFDSLLCLGKCNGLSVEAVRASLDWSESDFR